MTAKATKPPRKRAPSKEVLRRLARAARGGLLSIGDAATALEIPSRDAANRLAHLTRRGWLRRVKRGLYLILPLEAGGPSPVSVEDPWILAMRLFTPCYIGGWSAAEHWGLTEQLFRATFVVSAKKVRRSDIRFPAAEFHVVRAPLQRVVSVQPLWRGRERVPISDREQTLADGLANPAWVGGVRHLAEMLTTYRENSEWDSKKLLAAVAAVNSGAAFKRLGFLADTLFSSVDEIARGASARRTTGIIRLDPQIRGRGKLSTRWGLWVNVSLKPSEPT